MKLLLHWKENKLFFSVSNIGILGISKARQFSDDEKNQNISQSHLIISSRHILFLDTVIQAEAILTIL